MAYFPSLRYVCRLWENDKDPRNLSEVYLMAISTTEYNSGVKRMNMEQAESNVKEFIVYSLFNLFICHYLFMYLC